LGLALVVALVVSLLLSFVLYSRVKRQYAAMSQPVKIVAAARALEPGSPITADSLTQIDWPVNLPLEGSITQPGEVTGRIALYPIAEKEPIRGSMLAAPGATVGLTAKIPDGMRAVAVETNDVSNVSGFLFPGCHVDVLVTFRPENGRDSMTATVLQNTQVLSTGEKLQPDPSGKPESVRQVTLLLTPDQAERMVLAANQGTVQLALRNSSDQAEGERRPLQLRDLQITGAPVAVAGSRPPARAAATHEYEVESFDGTKKGVVKF
jgi:pilus assembly protein CpaB